MALNCMQRGVRVAAVAVVLAMVIVLVPLPEAVAVAVASESEGMPATGEAVTAEEGWTPVSHWWRNDDGTVTTELFTNPTFRETSTGWAPVDVSVTPTGERAFPAEAAEALHPISFGSRADQLVQFDIDGAPVTVAAEGLEVGEPSVEGPVVTYPQASTSTDLRYTVTASGLKADLVLHDADAPREFTFRLSDPERRLGKVTARRDGSWSFDREVAPGVITVLEAPYAYEVNAADGDAVTREMIDVDSAEMVVNEVEGGFEVVWRLNAEWLEGRSYPIVLDPTITFQPTSDKAMEARTHSSTGSTSSSCLVSSGGCTESEFKLRAGTDDFGASRSVVRFPLEAIPYGSATTAATFSLWWDGWCVSDRLLTVSPGQCYQQDYRFDVHRMTSGQWTDAREKVFVSDEWVDWDLVEGHHDPSRSARASYQGTSDLTQVKVRWFDWNVAGLVDGWTRGRFSNHGLMLRVTDESPERGGFAFESSRTQVGPDYRPRLVVTYTPAPTAPGNVNAVLNGSTATVSWDPAGTNGGSAIASYTVTTYTKDGQQVDQQTVCATCTSAKVSGLSDQVQYYAEVYATNGDGLRGATAQSDRFPRTDPNLGLRQFYTTYSHELTDRIDLHVNVANGNLVVHARDMALPGRNNHALTLERYHNSLEGTSSVFGHQRWTWGLADVFLTTAADGSAKLQMPSGYTADFAVGPTGFLSPAGVDATLVQESSGRYRLTFHREGSSLVLVDDGTGTARVTNSEDRNRNSIDFARDGATPRSINDSRGKTTALTWSSSAVSRIVDPANRRHDYTRDDKGRLASHRHPSNVQDSYTYDDKGRITKISVGNVVTATFAYDAKDRVTAITYPTDQDSLEGPTTRFVYSGGGTDPHSVVRDANGNDTTHYYDDHGRVTKTVDAKGNTTSTSYTANHNVASYTDALSAVQTTFDYDDQDNLTAVSLPTGATYRWGYDTTGAQPHLPTSQTDPQGHTLAYSYDAPGNLTKTTDPFQGELSVAYNGDGTVKTITDPKGNTTRFSYDTGTGDLTKVIPPSPLGAQTITTDALGRQTQQTDGKGQTTTFSHDTSDRLTGIVAGDGTSTSYKHDARGNVTEITHDPPGSQTGNAWTRSIFYDNLNRPTRIVGARRPLSTDPTRFYLMESRADYDAVGNLTEVRYASGAGPLAPAITDSMTRYLTGEDPGVEEAQWVNVSYVYDNVNLVTSVTEPGAEPSAEPITTRFEHDKNYRRTATHYPNGVTQRIRYDDSGRQTLITATGPDGNKLTTFEYTYDDQDSDTVLRQREKTLDGNVTDYDYDKLNRLVGATTRGPAGQALREFSYAYDASSNLTRQTAAGSTTHFAHNAANQICWAIAASTRPNADCNTTPTGARAFSYDANGNLTSDGQRTYGYNAGDQLTTIATAAETHAYHYADAGNDDRVALDDTYLMEDLLGVVRSFEELPAVDDSPPTITQYTRDPGGNLVSLRAPLAPGTDAGHTARIYHYLFDGLGSVVGLTNQDGELVQTYQYDPYGNEIAQPQPLLDPALTPNNPWRYAAGYHEQSTGLTKFGHRYYDPAVARWTQKDPLGDRLNPGNPAAAHAYNYAGCNPINNVDPTGLHYVGYSATADCYWALFGFFVWGVGSMYSILSGVGLLGSSIIVGSGVGVFREVVTECETTG